MKTNHRPRLAGTYDMHGLWSGRRGAISRTLSRICLISIQNLASSTCANDARQGGVGNATYRRIVQNKKSKSM